MFLILILTYLFRQMLESGVSVNIYMFYGGTNWGFTAGTHEGGENGYQAYITSYFLNAPIDETGDVTPKYLAIRDVIKDFLPLPNTTVSMLPTPKMQPPSINVHPKTTLLSSMARRHLGEEMKQSQYPMKFEELDQFSGFLLYETFLPDSMPDPSVLHIPHLHDFAIVCVDDVSKIMKQFSDSHLTFEPRISCRIPKIGHQQRGFFLSCFPVWFMRNI